MMTVAEQAKRYRVKGEDLDRLLARRNWTGDVEIEDDAFRAAIAKDLEIVRKPRKPAAAPEEGDE